MTRRATVATLGTTVGKATAPTTGSIARRRLPIYFHTLAGLLRDATDADELAAEFLANHDRMTRTEGRAA